VRFVATQEPGLREICQTNDGTCTGRIFEARRLSLEELPDEFGISRERPRQIEVPAVEKLKKGVRQCISASGHPQTSAIIMKP
jgi:hypothetical protein